jgi:toxin ParE1/3/4
MASYRLTRIAEADITDIIDYTIAAFGADQAKNYRDGLVRTFGFLAEFPRAARERLEIDPPVRAHPYKAHIILYVVEDEHILIVGVRHGREDWIGSGSDN